MGQFPTLEKGARLRFVELYPWSNTAALAGHPVAHFSWADRQFEVYCASIADWQEGERLLGRPPVGGEKGNVAVSGSPEEILLLAPLVLGGPGRCSLSPEEIGRLGYGFLAILREAVLVFFWVGPLSEKTLAEPQANQEAAPQKTPSDSTLEDGSGGAGSGTRGGKLSTSGRR